MHQLTNKEILIPGNSPLKPLTADITFQAGKTNQPLILLAHGFKGFKDWGPWPLLSEQIASEGFCLCKFNFSFNGVVPDNLNEITDAEVFGYNNFSKELDDLDRLLHFLG